MKSSRREFLQGAVAVAAVSLAGSRGALAEGATKPLEQFGYGDVELLEGPLREQFDRNHAFYGGLDENALLKPFREKAGMDAPGEEMGGWYSWAPLGDLDKRPNNGFAPAHSFGQYLSGLSRDYAATGNKATQEKVHRIVKNFAPAITPHFWEDNRFPAYTYDKISIGMLDAHQFAAAPDALKVLDKTLDSVWDHLPPGEFRGPSSTPVRTRMTPSAGMSRIRCRRTHSLRSSAGRGRAIRNWRSVFWRIAGIGIRWRRGKTCCRTNMPIAT